MASTIKEVVKISKDNRSEWSQPKFWQSLCPGLTITVAGSKSSSICTETVPSSDATQEQRRRRALLRTQGYAKVDGSSPDPCLVEKLRVGVQQLVSVGLPASFIFLFDETWTELSEFSKRVASPSIHPDNVFNYDVLAWYIDDSSAGGSGSGFSPHRDRQPDNAKETFHDCDDRGGGGGGGDAKFVTHWIAITDATPENSCLYVIPKPNDPGYVDGDTEDEDPLRRALSKKQDFQCIRALPRQAGTSLLFTHRIIHWGSSRDQDLPLGEKESVGNCHNAGHKLPNRIAISFVYCDPSYEPCYLTKHNSSSSSSSSNPAGDDSTISFSTRLLIVCAQLLIYYQRFSLGLETIHACYQYCKDHEDELEQSYRQKVFVEYVKACKEEIHASTSSSSGSSNKDGGDSKDSKDQEAKKPKSRSNDDDDGHDDDDSAEEAMLEEMLNAEDGGYGEFDDDYDEEFGDEDEEEYESEAREDEMEILRKEEKDNEDLLESIEGDDSDDDNDNETSDNDSTSRKRPRTA